MENIVLKADIIQLIKSDPMLFGLVASTLGISPATLPRILKANDPRLTQANVLKLISWHSGQQGNELLELERA